MATKRTQDTEVLVVEFNGLLEAADAHVNAVDKSVQRLDHQLFGNGQPGIVQNIRDEISGLRKDLGSIEKIVEDRHLENTVNAKWQARLIKIAIGAVVIMSMLSGSGVVTLDRAVKLFDALAK